MSDAYIQCGEFSGADKSGSPIYEIFEDIAISLTQDRRAIWDALLLGMKRDDEGNIMFRITKPMIPDLEPFLTEYIGKISTMYREKAVGFPDVFEALMADYEKESEGQTELKFHDVNKYVCVEDLLVACQHCMTTGDDVIVYNDYFP